MKKVIVFVLIFLVSIFVSKKIISPNVENNYAYSNSLETEQKQPEPIEIFTYSEIPDNIYQNMLGKSIPAKYKDNVDLSSLSYLQMSYYGFDNEVHTGEMIVNAKLAEDVLEIFKELYNIKYQIEKIRLIDSYNANDELSMQDNNTSCFCYRVVSGTKKLSNHAKGTAIDINPLYNPYVTGKIVSPSTATEYIDRTSSKNYMIYKNDDIYKIFIKHRLDLGRKLEKFKRLSTF